MKFKSLLCVYILGFTQISYADVKVSVSIEPLNLIAKEITKNTNASLTTIVPSSSSAHHYNLKPSDALNLQDADLFYWVGESVEGFLLKALKMRGKKTVELLDVLDIDFIHFDKEEHDHEHEHEEEHEDEEDDDDHEHDEHINIDGHIWLNPINAIEIAKTMTADLENIDAQNAYIYSDNLKQFTTKMHDLDNKIKQTLNNPKNKNYYVDHKAYGYFEKQYGLTSSGSIRYSSEANPSAKHLFELQQNIKSSNISCVFYENDATLKLSSKLAQNGVKFIFMDPVGRKLTKGQTYEDLILNLAHSFNICFK